MQTSQCAYFHILCAHFRDNHICQNTVNVNVIDACDQTTLLQPVTTNGTYGMIKTTSNSCYEFSLHNPTLSQCLPAVCKLFFDQMHPPTILIRQMNEHYSKNSFQQKHIYLIQNLQILHEIYSRLNIKSQYFTRVKSYSLIPEHRSLYAQKILYPQQIFEPEATFRCSLRNPGNSPSRIGCRPLVEDAEGSIPALPPLLLCEVDG